MAAGLGRMLSRIAQTGPWRPRRCPVLLLRFEGMEGLVARLGADEADLICQAVQERLSRDLAPEEGLLAQNGNEIALILPPRPEGELMLRAAILRRGCEAPAQRDGRRVSLRVTGVLVQGRGRASPPDERMIGAASAHLRTLPPSRRGALWTIEVDDGSVQAVAPSSDAVVHHLVPPQARHAAPAAARAAPEGQHGVAGASSGHFASALREGGLELWFLPIYCCATGAPTGFEVRPRWRHPRLGLSGTAAFQTGLDTEARSELTRQLLAGAASALAALSRQGCARATLALAVSDTELCDRYFAERLLWAADAEDVEPSRFELSFDEDALPPAAATAALGGVIAGNLRRLRDAGVTLTIARFGTGALDPVEARRFGAGGVMLDRALIRGIGGSEVQPMLVSILALAKREGLAVAADGVASAESLALLSRLGCDRARGPGLGRTVPLSDCPAQMVRAIPLWEVLPAVFRTRRTSTPQGAAARPGSP